MRQNPCAAVLRLPAAGFLLRSGSLRVECSVAFDSLSPKSFKNDCDPGLFC